MSEDEDAIRKQMLQTGQPKKDLAKASQTWTTEQMKRDFEVIGFAAPFVVVIRKSDRKRGSLEFTHSPRVYFNFEEHDEDE